MPLKIIRNDITYMKVDAIVNPTDQHYSGKGGTDYCIHNKAGVNLKHECSTLEPCMVSEAKITKGYNLDCDYIIHTVGPKYIDGKHNEVQLLRNCYFNCFNLALKYNISSIAFPLISSGTFSFPKDQVLHIALQCIKEFLEYHNMDVYLVVYDMMSFSLSLELENDIEDYLKDHYEVPAFSSRLTLSRLNVIESSRDECIGECISLKDYLDIKDESFSEMLLRKIDEYGMSDSECYKKANIDRKLFSKIRSQKNYKPSKNTVLAFCIALELDIDETKEMLNKAGYALSKSYKSDVIVEYFILNKKYDIFEINEALFYYDQSLL